MGERKLYEEQIMKLIQNMPEQELPKVISIIEEQQRISSEKTESYLRAIDKLNGKFKGKLSSSEEFRKKKQEEKLLDK